VPAGKAEELREVAQRRPRDARARRRSDDGRPATTGPDEADGDLDERRLACAVRAEEAYELSLLDGEVDALQCFDGAVALRQVADRQRRRHHPRLATGPESLRYGRSSGERSWDERPRGGGQC